MVFIIVSNGAPDTVTYVYGISFICSVAALILINFSSSCRALPVDISLIGILVRLAMILFKWSSLDISVSNIKTGIPREATFKATLSANTDLPTPGLAETKSTHFLLHPPPITASNLGKPVATPI